MDTLEWLKVHGYQGVPGVMIISWTQWAELIVEEMKASSFMRTVSDDISVWSHGTQRFGEIA